MHERVSMKTFALLRFSGKLDLVICSRKAGAAVTRLGFRVWGGFQGFQGQGFLGFGEGSDRMMWKKNLIKFNKNVYYFSFVF